MTVKELVRKSGLSDAEKALQVILLLIDQEQIAYNDSGLLVVSKYMNYLNEAFKLKGVLFEP